MPPEIAAADVERFREQVARWLGLRFDETKLSFLSEVLRDRAAEAGGPVSRYLHALESGDGFGLGERRKLASELTVAETYFFRNMEQLRAFQDALLPPIAPPRELRVLSAGCASGEEPYSLAISILERWPEAQAPAVSVRGVDINPRMLAKANAARFSRWSLRETPPELQRRWLDASGAEFVVDDRVRSLVAFEEVNLAAEDVNLWRPKQYHAVFCRNVLMYLTVEKARAIVARIANALVPGGLLFLGYAETLRNLSGEFHLRHSHETFYYQLRDPAGRALAVRTELRPDALPAAPLADVLDTGASWVEAIQRASDRVHDLSREARTAGASTGASAAAEPIAGARAPLNLGSALHMLREERFDEALGQLALVQPEFERDPDVLQLRAALLVNAGRRAEAEQLAWELLQIDELNAGAHYILALCNEHSGARESAIDHDRLAIYLDPTFSMPRLHLAILAKRVNQRELARSEFSKALALIEREEASKLLLFGGGFGREALLSLCRAELASFGGAP